MSGSARDRGAARRPPDKSPDRIAGMFDAIAPRYDLLNHLLSAGIDRWWRKRAIDSLALTGRETLVDVCTGTADVALEARAPRRGGARAARVVGVDFAGAMLALGVGKVRRAGESSGASRWCAATRCGCRSPSESADAVTIAFGIRNVHDRQRRVRRDGARAAPGGRLAILEFGVPRVPGLRALYHWYFTAVLPRVGRLVSGHTGAYSYLPASVGTFPPPAEFARMLEARRLRRTSAQTL